MPELEVRVPNIGDLADVPVAEVLVRPGDSVEVEQSLLTLESDKATMDVPSPAAGIVKQVDIHVGDRVSEGSLIMILECVAVAQPKAATMVGLPLRGDTLPIESLISLERVEPRSEQADFKVPELVEVHASPAVRLLARELGVDLSAVTGSGLHGRVLKGDVRAFVNRLLSKPNLGSTLVGDAAPLNLAPEPRVDYAKFGPVESVPLSRIKRLSGAHLHRSWVSIPHVTSHEDADVTDLEAFRTDLNEQHVGSGVRITLLPFIIKAVVETLEEFPEFNSSLDGGNLCLKRYYNIGVAIDTPLGLVVPVLKDAYGKRLIAIARELADFAGKARDGKLSPSDMEGGTFTVSSLGGIGGTAFTPIINTPEVAILGVSRAVHKPVWNGSSFGSRYILPLSLSWDHRVIDGASAARFNAHLAWLLTDMRRAIL